MADSYSVRFELTPALNVQALNTILSNLKSSLGSFGKEITLIDATKLENDLKKVTAATKTFGNEANTGFTQAGRGAENFGNKLKETSSQVTNAETKMKGFQKVVAGAFNFNMVYQSTQILSNGLSKVIEVGENFTKQLKAVGAFTGQTGKDLDALGEKARELGIKYASVGKAADQLQIFGAILSKFGPEYGKSADAMEILARNVNVLAKAGGTDVATAVNVMSNAMLQFGLRTGDANKDAEISTRIINQLAEAARVGASEIPQTGEALLQVGGAARNANISVRQTLSAIQVLALGGKEGAEAGTSLRNIIGLMQRTTMEGASSLASMGLSARQLGQTLTEQGLAAAIKLLQGGLEKLPTTFEKNNAIMKLFGLENQQAFAVLSANIDKMDEFDKAIQEGELGQGTAFEMFNQKSGTASGNIAKMKAKIEDVYISLSKFMGTSVQTVLMASTQVAPMILSFTSLKAAIPEGGMKKFGDSLLKLGGNAKNLAVKLLSTLVPSLVTVTATETATGVAGATAGTAINVAWGPVLGIIAGIVAAGAGLYLFFTKTKAGADTIKFLGDMFKGLSEQIKIAIDWIGGAFIDVFNWVKNTISALKPAIAVIGAILLLPFAPVIIAIKLLKDNWSSIWKLMQEIGDWISTAFVNTINLLGNTWNGLISIIQNVVNWISNAFNDVVNFITNTLNSIKNFLQTVFSPVYNTIANIFNRIKITITNVFNAIKSVIKPVVDWIGNQFKVLYDTAMSIINALSSAVQWVGGLFDGKKETEIKVNAKIDTKIDEQSEKQINNDFENIKQRLEDASAGIEEGRIVGRAGTSLMRKLQQDVASLAPGKEKDELNAMWDSIYASLTKKNQQSNKERANNTLQTREKLTQDLLKLDEELENKRSELNTKRIDEQIVVEYKKLEESYKKQDDLYANQINKLMSDYANTSDKTSKSIIEKQINDLTQLQNINNEIRLEALNEFYTKAGEENRKANSEILKSDVENTKKRLDVLKELQSYLSGQNLIDNLEEQTQLSSNLIAKESEQRINAILNEDEGYKMLVDEMTQLDLLYKATGDKKYEIDLTEARKNLNDYQQTFLETNSTIANINFITNNKIIENEKNQQNELKRIRIDGIKNITEQQRQIQLYEAQKTLEQELSQAGSNQTAILSAYGKFTDSKLAIEQRYYLQSNQLARTYNDFLTAMQSVNSIAINSKNNDEQKSQLNKQEEELRNSFQNREIAYQSYINQLNDVDKKRNELSKQSSKEYWTTLQDYMKQAFSKMEEQTIANLNNTLSQYQQHYTASIQLRKQKEETEANIQRAYETNNNAEFEKYANEYAKINETSAATAKQTTQMQAQAYIQLAEIAGAVIGEMITGQTSFAKGLVKIAAQSITTIARMYEAKIIAEALSTPDSVATFGVSGWARVAILVPAIETAIALVNALSNSMGRWTGGIIKGGQQFYKVNEHGEEFVINHRTTSKNLKMLDYINSSDKSPLEYYRKYEPDTLKKYFLDTNDYKEIISMTNEQIPYLVVNNNSKDITQEIKSLKNDLQTINDSIKEGNYARREYTSVEADIHVDNDYFKVQERKKIRDLRNS